jgi:hypothetical protein
VVAARGRAYMLDLIEVGRVAQLVEQCPFKAWVAGSSPAALTNFLLLVQSLLGRLKPQSNFPNHCYV